MGKLEIVKRPEILTSDDKRVITRFFSLGKPERVQGVINRLVKIPHERVGRELSRISERFGARHLDLESTLLEHSAMALRFSRTTKRLNDQQRLLLGAYVTLEYTFESAALFNPSMVPHPDQTDLPEGSMRFLMSLRATGEGHLSSIVFRRGVIDADGDIHFDPPPRFAYAGRPEFPSIEADNRLKPLLEQCRPAPRDPETFKELSNEVMLQLSADYRVQFPKECKPSEIVLFPATRFESRGMEDLRLVRFQNEGKTRYLGTYTAYDGSSIRPMLIETADFHEFHVSPMFGDFVKNKGMAIFPRKVGNRYCAISRHDSVNLFLLQSKDLGTWNQAKMLMQPEQEWELIKLGNCGSPIETEHGWLLITHGVGPMREYGIGVVLLDLNDPSRIIGRLPTPLICAEEHERSGYVPNVVYSCGSVVHNGHLVVPYAMSDSRTAFATVAVDSLVETLKDNVPLNNQ